MAPAPDDLVTIDCSKEGRIFKMRFQNVDSKSWRWSKLQAFIYTPPGVFQRGLIEPRQLSLKQRALNMQLAMILSLAPRNKDIG